MKRQQLDRDELYRYARHIALPDIGLEGQQRLKRSRVLCVGAGGLGSPLAMYLAAAGVGTIGMVDDDVVDESNLQRQLLHGTSDVGRSKLDSAIERLFDVNPNVKIEPHYKRLSSSNALEIFGGYHVVVDGTDNFPTRYLVNDACVLLGIPNVYGSVFRWEGQVSVFANKSGPCYRCLFREPPPPGLVPNCAEGGVLGALPGIIGTMQAMEAIKLILEVGKSLVGRLMIFDALEMSWREVGLRRNPTCPVCGDEPTQLNLIDYEVFCGVKSESGEEVAEASETDVERVEEIVPREASRLLGEEVPPFLLDVREPWEWAVSNLGDQGARLISLAELTGRMSEVPSDRTIIVYCRSGQRSRTGARMLIEGGRRNVLSLRGGLKAWSDEVDLSMRVV